MRMYWSLETENCARDFELLKGYSIPQMKGFLKGRIYPIIAFSQKIEHSLNCKISIATAGIQSSWGSFQGIVLFNQILNCSCIRYNFIKFCIINFINCIL